MFAITNKEIKHCFMIDNLDDIPGNATIQKLRDDPVNRGSIRNLD